MNVPGWTDWTFAPTFAAVLVLVGLLYLRAFRRARSKPGGAHLGVANWGFYLAGLLVLAITFFSPLASMDEYLLSAHMAEHVLLADVAPALIILGLRGALLPLGLSPQMLRIVARRGRAGRIFGVLTSPWFAVPVWGIVMISIASPPMAKLVASNQVLHVITHMLLFYAGLLFWWVVVDPLPAGRRRAKGQRLAYLGFSRVASAVVCLPLTFLSTVFYPFYGNAAAAYGLTPLSDQQLAGASMCFTEVLIFGIAFCVVFIDLLNTEERDTELREGITYRADAAGSGGGSTAA